MKVLIEKEDLEPTKKYEDGGKKEISQEGGE